MGIQFEQIKCFRANYPLEEIEFGICKEYQLTKELINPPLDEDVLSYINEQLGYNRYNHVRTNICSVKEPYKICIALYDGADVVAFERAILLFNADEFVLFKSKIKGLSEKHRIDAEENHKQKELQNVIELNEFIYIVNRRGKGGSLIQTYTKKEKTEFMKIYNTLKNDSLLHDKTYQMIDRMVKDIVGDGRFKISEKIKTNYTMRDLIFTIYNR